MATIYTIEVDGTVLSEERMREPSYDERKSMLGLKEGDCMEHVSVLFNGKLAHMYIDEEGKLKRANVDEDGEIRPEARNGKASCVYANKYLYDNGMSTYDDLAKAPPHKEVHVRTIWGDMQELVIVGRAILWTGKQR
jgi:hypothetical protein